LCLEQEFGRPLRNRYYVTSSYIVSHHHTCLEQEFGRTLIVPDLVGEEGVVYDIHLPSHWNGDLDEDGVGLCLIMYLMRRRRHMRRRMHVSDI
jgi:hypothetical protein